MEKPKAVLFDAYGTLFDVYSVGLLAEQLFPGQGSALGVLVARQADRIHPAGDHEQWRRALPAVLGTHPRRPALCLQAPGAGPRRTEREERLMNQYRHLSAFPENKEVLAALKGKGVVTGILCNGDPRDARHRGAQRRPGRPARPRAQRRQPCANTRPTPTPTRSGRRPRGWTPSRSPSSAATAGTRLAATWFGYRTLWVNRYQLPFEELGTAAHPHRRQPARRPRLFLIHHRFAF